MPARVLPMNPNSQLVPKRIYLTVGAGRHEDALFSFELALRAAGIAPYNHVIVSSIIPPDCELIETGSTSRIHSRLAHGQIAFGVMARDTVLGTERRPFASIGCARPRDRSTHGYLTEYHGLLRGHEYPVHYARSMAAEMLHTMNNIQMRDMECCEALIRAEGADNMFCTVVAAGTFVF